MDPIFFRGTGLGSCYTRSIDKPTSNRKKVAYGRGSERGCVLGSGMGMPNSPARPVDIHTHKIDS